MMREEEVAPRSSALHDPAPLHPEPPTQSRSQRNSVDENRVAGVAALALS